MRLTVARSKGRNVMFRLNWLENVRKQLQSRANSRRQRSSDRPCYRHRLTIEALEDRTMPAVFNPLVAAADGAAGSLRAAVIAANSNGQSDVFNLQAGTYELTLANGAGGQENA